MTNQRRPAVPAPADKILLAIELIYRDRGDGGWLEEMPALMRIWDANRDRAEWLVEKHHHIEELDGPLIEPPLVLNGDER